MSFFSALKTDFDKIKALFEDFFKAVPTWAQVAEVDLAYIAPVITKIITSLGGSAIAADASAVLQDIQNDLVLAVVFVQDVDTSTNLTDVLNDIVDNLQGLLTIAEVKSSSAIDEVTAYVTGIVGEIQAILVAIGEVTGATAPVTNVATPAISTVASTTADSTVLPVATS